MSKDLRHTRQRLAIVSVLNQSWHPLTPAEIRDRAAESIASIGIATVYRTLRHLCKKGEVERIAIPGMRSCYALSRSGPRTFFCCSQTGKIKIVEGGRVELKASQVPEGFKPKRYEVIVHGHFTSQALASQSPEKSARPEKD